MVNEKERYIQELEDTIKKFLEPIKGVPYPIVIKALTGYQVFKFNSVHNEKYLSLLIKASKLAGFNAAKYGIEAKRPNEAGNKIEPYVIEALNKVGINANKPQTASGKLKATGYPDIEMKYDNIYSYLDCKTFAPESKDSSFRAFYLSPSKDPKITRNAYHFILSYELIYKSNLYYPVSWHLYDLYGLSVQVKYEFNASNRELYSEKLLLAEGKISL